MTDDKEKNGETLRFLIEQKMASMNTAGNVCMTWWVSSVVFCGSILAAVWLQREELAKSGFFLLASFSFVLTVFFAGIVIFGIVAIKYLKKFHKDIFALAKELNQEGVFCTEVIYFKRAMEIGTGSFALIFIAWIILCISLWIEY
ncbi:MAG TPA: hypothetical protein VFQ47_04665 [Nitrososphaera sp.]|jgi:hypothetical protein|nr:hypothetical protein [Nitrososphaera sp.]